MPKPTLRVPLRDVEPQLLQVLVDRLCFSDVPDGMNLTIDFGDDTLAIWRKAAKPKPTEFGLSDQQVEELQHRIDGLLLRREFPLNRIVEDRERNLVFRHANGGTLPIVRYRHKTYYVLFLRDVDPLGWNLANGGSDTLDELCHPEQTIERELAEELFVVDREQGVRYVFTSDGNEIQRVDTRSLLSLWEQRTRQVVGFETFLLRRLPLTWVKGPDTLTVIYKNRPYPTTGCFLNVTVRDLGIEIDRIATMHVPDTATLCDGEILNGQLIDRPIGLFEVGEMNRKIAQNPESTEFLPHVLFHSARKIDISSQGAFHNAVREFAIRKTETFGETACEAMEMADRNHFPLCPVTRSILIRAERLNLEVSEVKPRILLGHGRDPVWQDVLSSLEAEGYDVDSFEKVGSGGNQVIPTLQRMLKDCDVAVIVATAEDAVADNEIVARQNVVHEIGLCQASFGFDRVLVLRQVTTRMFSNLDGLIVVEFETFDVKVAERLLDAVSRLP